MMGKQNRLSRKILYFLFCPMELLEANERTFICWTLLVSCPSLRKACIQPDVLDSIAFVSKAEESEVLFILLLIIVVIQAIIEGTAVCVEVMVARNRIVTKTRHFFSQLFDFVAYLLELLRETGIVDISQMKNNSRSSIEHQLIQKIK